MVSSETACGEKGKQWEEHRSACLKKRTLLLRAVERFGGRFSINNTA